LPSSIAELESGPMSDSGGLAGLLGGYGSGTEDEDEQMVEQQAAGAGGASSSTTHWTDPQPAPAPGACCAWLVACRAWTPAHAGAVAPPLLSAGAGLAGSLATYGSAEAAEGEGGARGLGGAAGQQLLPGTATNPEPPSQEGSPAAGGAGAGQGRWEEQQRQQQEADPLSMLPPEYR
jgi:hypothetical protein